MESSDQIIKVSYHDFWKASQGDKDLVKRCVEVFKFQKMLVISDTPEAQDVTNQVYDVAAQMDQTELNKSPVFSANFKRYPNGAYSHMSNVFTHNNALENAAKLGYRVEDSADLLLKVDLPIQGYKEAISTLTDHSMKIGELFMTIIDQDIKDKQG